MQDIEAAKVAFLAEIKILDPDRLKEFTIVLDDLIEWSKEQHPRVKFVWHDGAPGSKKQHLVQYCVPGIASPFWAAWPGRGDGTKFSLLADAKQKFPEELRQDAREILARIDGRKAKQTEVPEVGFAKLIWRPHRQAVFELMTRLLDQLNGAVKGE